MGHVYNGNPGNTSRAASVNIASSTPATPIVITTSAAHGLIDGDRIDVGSHQVNTAANGAWYAHVLSPTTVALYAAWSAGVFSSPAASNGTGGATGAVVFLGLMPRATLPDDGVDLRTAAAMNVPNENEADAQAWLAERVGGWRHVGHLQVTKAGATPGTAITASTTCAINAWSADANADGAWLVRPQIGVEVNDYVEVDLSGTVSVAASPADNVALGIGFVLLDYGSVFSLLSATQQDGYQQFESGHVHGFHLKARLYLSTLLASITHGAILYPVLMNYGLAGAPTYILEGDMSCTIKLWRANV